jgi:hypothetical protein
MFSRPDEGSGLGYIANPLPPPPVPLAAALPRPFTAGGLEGSAGSRCSLSILVAPNSVWQP